ncbi:MAG: sigma-70 family RNA polymerase sigma factor [Anaerolineae bacterium]
MPSPIERTDRQLVLQARSGQPEAYGELVCRYQTGVYNIALRLTDDRQQALDLAQEAFVRAYQALDSFDAARPFGPWIHRIVTNTTLNWLQARHPTVSLDEEQEEHPDQVTQVRAADAQSDPEQVVLTAEAHQALRQALLRLPAMYRTVIELRHMQELSYEEIAGTLKLPLSDVKSYLFRARQMLKKILEEQADFHVSS